MCVFVSAVNRMLQPAKSPLVSQPRCVTTTLQPVDESTQVNLAKVNAVLKKSTQEQQAKSQRSSKTVNSLTSIFVPGNVVDRKSTFGCCFSLGSASISWMSKKQKSVALSTAEVEYIAASMASCEVVCLLKLFSELFGFTLDTIVILCDNQRGIRLLENPVFHDRSKHIDIRYHYIWDMEQWGEIRLQHIGTDEQVANILTKPLGKVKLLTFRK
eukprot:PITA_16132